MSLIKEIRIQNFKCYREETIQNLEQSNFFIGANNAGKSAILKAMHCFFEDSQYDSEFINKTEYRSKKAGYNKSTITIGFDLNYISSKELKKKLIKEFGEILMLKKNFVFREKTNSILINYTINDVDFQYENLSDNLLHFLSKISVSYIHPQEAKELLSKAQDKLKSRLLSNWGRNAVIAETLKQLQSQWSELRSKANSYLSNGLTQSLQNIWPGCITTVDLPASIEQIIGVSEILFRGAEELPDVSLTSQGTGAQSTILYQTHFLLDSDKTLHRGFYHPIWLIEEPEAFLHADIIYKLGALLCSDLWMNNIQMLITTHSPTLLSTSKNNIDRIIWSLIDNYQNIKSKKVIEWNDEEIKDMGKLMGDPNFDIYFKTSDKSKVIIIEDSKEITQKKLIEFGIPITNRLNGIPEVRRYFNVLNTLTNSDREIFFLIDNDKGIAEFKNVLPEGEFVKETSSGFKKYKFNNKVYLLVFPDNHAVEELFVEHDEFLESCANSLFNHNYTSPSDMVPGHLSRAHGAIRGKVSTSLETAKELIRNQQDVKDTFWKNVESENYRIREEYLLEMIELIN